MKAAVYILAVASFVSTLVMVNIPPDNSVNTESGYDEMSEKFLSEDMLLSVGASLEYVLGHRKIPKTPLKDIFFDSKKYQENMLENDNKAPLIENSTATKNNKIITIPHLVGIVIRRNEAKALFIDGDQSYSLKKGDRLAGRYRIQSISSDKVKIIDISSKLSRTIYIMDEWLIQ